jgi:hypothetical protein
MEKTKMEKTISGTDLQQTDEKRTWRCTFKTKDGEIVTMPFEVILKLITDYNIVVDVYRNHCRAKEIVK